MYFPFMVDLLYKNIVIIGGGSVACRKCELFISFGAEVTVVSPVLHEDFLKLEGSFRYICDLYAPEYLRDAFAVIAATDDRGVNEEIHFFCCRNKIPVNVVDTPELCTFIVPATLRRGALTIGISTGGKSPSLSGRIKKELFDLYGEEYAEKVELLGKLREIVKEDIKDIEIRRRILAAASELSNQEIKAKIACFEPERETCG